MFFPEQRLQQPWLGLPGIPVSHLWHPSCSQLICVCLHDQSEPQDLTWEMISCLTRPWDNFQIFPPLQLLGEKLTRGPGNNTAIN